MPICTAPTRRAPGTVVAAIVVSLGFSCGLINPNIFDTDIRLARQDYAYDFGKAQAAPADKVPTVACSAAADPCQKVSDQLQGNQVTARCDLALKQCYVEGSMMLPYAVNLAQDASFQSSVGQKAVEFVQKIELGYAMVNSLTFDLPQVELYVGPQDAKNKTDPGVVLVAKIGPFKAGAGISDSAPMSIAVEKGTPAFTQLERNIKNPKVPFVFLIAATARADAGQPTPAGKIEMHVFPKITVGLPRS